MDEGDLLNQKDITSKRLSAILKQNILPIIIILMTLGIFYITITIIAKREERTFKLPSLPEQTLCEPVPDLDLQPKQPEDVISIVIDDVTIEISKNDPAANTVIVLNPNLREKRLAVSNNTQPRIIVTRKQKNG